MTTDALVGLSDEEIIARVRDPMWRLSNLYQIISKGEEDDEGLVVTFKPNRVQRRILSKLHSRNVILKARQLGCCLDPDTKVLTADLRWVRIGDIQPGDEVVSVDEHVPGGKGASRKMRTATVQATRTMQAERFRVTFDDGRQVVCTANHPWLSRSASQKHWDWRSLTPRAGEGPKKRLKVGMAVRSVTMPWGESQLEDYWFGGMLDGEGSLAKPSRTGAQVVVAQRLGPVWDRLRAYVTERGYNWREDGDASERPSKFGRVPVPKIAVSRMDELFRLIGQCRPTRFLGKRWWEDKDLPGKGHGCESAAAVITSIEAIGPGEVVDLQTSTGTYIAEGLVSHNTTLVTILWLDTALFSSGPIRCGVIAHEREAAEEIFRDKVVYAYEHLPDVLQAMFPLKKRTQTQLVFGHNGASIRVATSMRSGTIHRLHVSELGKIAAKYPAKAREVIAGSIPAVPKTGLLVVESTAEGQDGVFHDMTMAALALAQKRADLNPRQYRLHFFPWWQADEYEIDPVGVVIPQALADYFARVEARIGRSLSPRKRAWYAATLEADFAGEQPLMWQEYPSYPEEAFAASTDGCYYATQLAVARRDGRVLKSLPVEAVPVNTFWDLGRGDMTAVWLHQRVGVENRFIGYYEESGHDLIHYVQWLHKQAQERGLVYGRHYLPHEAAARRMGATPDTSRTLEEMFLDLMPGAKTTVVPRVTSLQAGIQATRNSFASSWFDETQCHQGLQRLAGYKRKWDKVRGRWSEDEDQTDDNHGADAYRQFGQEADAGNRFAGAPLPASTGGRPDPQGPTAARSAASRWRRRGSPMAV